MDRVASAEAAYAALGLRFGASAEDVRGAYRTLLRRYHPDTGTEEPEAIRRLADVRAAYERLRPRGPSPDAVARERALDAYRPPAPPAAFDVLA